MNVGVWRAVAVVLAVAVIVLAWQSRRRPAHDAGAGAAARTAAGSATERGGSGAARAGPEPDGGAGELAAHDEVYGDDWRPPPVSPNWLITFFAPHPGEDLLAYRDRMVPVAQAVVAPQRARVTRDLDEFSEDARLTHAQREELSAAVEQAADAIKDRVMQGVLSGELLPPNVKPATAVGFARDVLDHVDGAHQRFSGSLSDEQRAILASSRFDVAEYLLFSTRWEEMLGVAW
jgi:hypothetical protein